MVRTLYVPNMLEAVLEVAPLAAACRTYAYATLLESGKSGRLCACVKRATQSVCVQSAPGVPGEDEEGCLVPVVTALDVDMG